MPELPEVETIRRTLEPVLLGATITRAALTRGRRDIVTGPARPADLLLGARITELRRHGKQLALIGSPAISDGPQFSSRSAEAPLVRILIIQLGMSGQLFFLPDGASPPRLDHIHARWHIDQAGSAGTVIFRDPRRFGGLTTLASQAALDERWGDLGPDALLPPPFDEPSLARLWRSARAVKAALLDQSLIAGVGNIYADEALFRARIHPLTPPSSIDSARRQELLGAIGAVLNEAISAGGSSLRDYLTGSGEPGEFQLRHRVYGRGGQPCFDCGSVLVSEVISQRTTTWCPVCQQR